MVLTSEMKSRLHSQELQGFCGHKVLGKIRKTKTNQESSLSYNLMWHPKDKGAVGRPENIRHDMTQPPEDTVPTLLKGQLGKAGSQLRFKMEGKVMTNDG